MTKNLKEVEDLVEEEVDSKGNIHSQKGNKWKQLWLSPRRLKTKDKGIP